MASSSHESSENLTGLELVVYVPPETKNDKALQEQSPIVISLKKFTHSRKESESQTPEDGDRVSDELSIKLRLQKDCFKEMFTMEEQLGSTKKVFWSRPINFKLPEDSVYCFLKMDEEAQVIPGVDRLSLFERLEGWNVEKRQRDNSQRYDKYFYHKKSKGRFRSFIEVETYIIHGRFPQRPQHKDRKPKEDPSALLTWGSESSQAASFKRKRTSRNFNSNKKKRWMVEEFLEKAWNNLLNSGIQKEDVHSSDNDHEPKVKETLSESYNNVINSFSTNKDQKVPATNDCDEETRQMITEIMDVEDGNAQIFFNDESKAPQENEVEQREQGRKIEGDSTTMPSQNDAPVDEGPTVHELFLSHLSAFEKYLESEENSAPDL